MTQKILALDDELHMLKLLERIIREKTPYQIMTTNNSLEAPEILERNQIDLIITDLKMPGLDGLEILKFVKEKNLQTEVIIITAFGSLETAIEALSRGVFDYITKPFKKEQIVFTVDRAMRYQSMRRENEKLSGIMTREPYESALKVFKQEYIRRLASKYAGDVKTMTERSGLPPEEIDAVMQDKKAEE
jgi:DNA-binding NtrC family response regulator